MRTRIAWRYWFLRRMKCGRRLKVWFTKCRFWPRKKSNWCTQWSWAAVISYRGDWKCLKRKGASSRMTLLSSLTRWVMRYLGWSRNWPYTSRNKSQGRRQPRQIHNRRHTNLTRISSQRTGRNPATSQVSSWPTLNWVKYELNEL